MSTSSQTETPEFKYSINHHDKKKKNKKIREKSLRPSAFPLCVQDRVTGQVRIFGSSVTLTLPLELNFLAFTGSVVGSPIVGLTLQGSCSSPIVTLTLNVGGVNLSFSFGSIGGVCSLTATSTPTAGLLSNVVISGVPLLGVTGDIGSDCPSTSNLSIHPVCDNTAIITGVINQFLRFTGIAAPLPTTLLNSIANQILGALLSTIPASCLTSTVADLIAALANPTATAFLTALVALVGLALTDTLAAVLTALIPFLVPTVVADLASLAAAASNVPTTLGISTDFKTIFSDCALGEIKKCDKICIKPNPRVEFKGTTPLSITLTPTELTQALPIVVSTTCLTTTSTTFPVTVTDFLAAAGIVGTGTIPAIGCVSLISGGACVPFSPAVTIEDALVVCIDQGRGCCPPKTILSLSQNSINNNNNVNNIGSGANFNPGVSFGGVRRGCNSC
jgi:hypothetical protein